jgi:predicted nuclease of restriction endonuclease-like (RecB) superfamily
MGGGTKRCCNKTIPIGWSNKNNGKVDMATTKKKYIQWFAELKNSIQHSQLQTALQVNRNMLVQYWYIGKQVSIKIDEEGWGANVIEQLAIDLAKSFPDVQGYSVRNLKYMRQFATIYPELLIGQQPAAQLAKSNKAIVQQPAAQLKKNKKNTFGQQPAAQMQGNKNAIVQQPVAQFGETIFNVSNIDVVSIPWGHHMLLLDKVEELDERFWYIENTIKNNWSRAVLKYQLDTDLYLRQVKKKKDSNFHLTLPKPQSDLANQIIKDPYVFHFLNVDENISELDLEKALIKHIQEFLVELGAGFAFVGRQIKLSIGKKERRLDLLFYHLHLRCYIVFELKMDEFEMEHVGQMNTYLNVVNKQLKHEHDNPSIGIILCNGKDSIEVDFALTNVNHPIGVSDYKFSKALPKKLKGKMPTAKQIEDEVKRFLKKRKARLK